MTSRGRLAWGVWLGIILLFGAPLLRVIASGPPPLASDWAAMELRTRDVFSAHPPLLGAYSRLGWAHPGPLVFYAFALPYRLFGSGSSAMRLAAFIVNAAAVWAAVWLLARRGWAALTAGACAIAATIWTMRAEEFWDPWNATVAIMPFLLTVIGCWAVLCRDRRAVLITTAAFVFAAQAHVGAGVALLPVVAVALVVSLVRVRSARPLLAPAVLAIALSVPVVIDTVANWPGNAWRILQWSSTSDEPRAGLGRAIEIVGRQTSLSFLRAPRLPVFGAYVPDPLPSVIAPGALLVLLVAATGVARWRGLREELALCWVMLSAWLGCLAGSASVRGLQFDWLYGWIPAVAWISWAAVALVAWRVLAPRLGARRSSARVLAWIAAAVLIVGMAVAAAPSNSRASIDFVELGPVVAELAPPVAAADLEEPVRVDFAGLELQAGAVHAGLVNELARRGIDVRVAEALGLEFGERRVDRGTAKTHLLVRREPVTTPPPEGAEVIAVSDPLDPAERAEADRLTAELTELLEAEGLQDQLPLLDSVFAPVIAQGDAPPAVRARAADFERLTELGGGQRARYVVYRLDP